jgi:hypothetical protein
MHHAQLVKSTEIVAIANSPPQTVHLGDKSTNVCSIITPFLDMFMGKNSKIYYILIIIIL